MSASSWLSRYRAGDHVVVWNEMVTCAGHIRESSELRVEAEAVARETMRRVRHNLEQLEQTLRSAGYEFKAEQPETEWPAQVLTDPAPGDESILDSIEEGIGPIPLSVRAFLLEVGGVSFVGDLPGWNPRYGDALEVCTSLETLQAHLLDMRNEEWSSFVDLAPAGTVLLELAPDYLHKADISGGMPYGVLVPDVAADGLWRFDDLHANVPFVDYLRSAIADGGLPGWRRTPCDEPPPAIRDLTAHLISF